MDNFILRLLCDWHRALLQVTKWKQWV